MSSIPNNKYRVHIYDDVADAVHAAAQCWVELAAQAITARGEFHVALSGGTTPRALYEYLASAEFSAQIAWQHVHIWFGDERTVPPQHPDSNYRMAHDALLCHVPILSAHIHRMQGEQDNVHDAASAYQARRLGSGCTASRHAPRTRPASVARDKTAAALIASRSPGGGSSRWCSPSASRWSSGPLRRGPA